jgi:pyridoxal phosphate enzyme (YggS family)
MTPLPHEPQDPALRERLVRVQDAVQAACRRASRDPTELSLVVVTKSFPASIIRKACALGLVHIGENRVQEIIEKFGDGQLFQAFPKLTLHLIGHLQSNKVRKVVPLVASIDSLDSLHLGEDINRAGEQVGRPVRVLIEVNTSGEPQKFGVQPEQVYPLVHSLANRAHLRLAGLMTVGPNVPDSKAIRHSFKILRKCFEDIRGRMNLPGWSVLSMGMSGDYEIAIEEGATEIRLGTALFGERSAL